MDVVYAPAPHDFLSYDHYPSSPPPFVIFILCVWYMCLFMVFVGGVCVCMCTHTCVLLGGYGSQRLMSGVFHHSRLYFLRQSL